MPAGECELLRDTVSVATSIIVSVGWTKASIGMSPAEASTIRTWLCSRCKNSLQRNLLSGLDPQSCQGVYCMRRRNCEFLVAEFL